MGFLDWFKRKGKVATAKAIARSPNRRWRYASDGVTKVWV